MAELHQIDHNKGPIDHVLPSGERVMSNREFGKLIHTILHEPTPTKEQLEKMGYSFKELDFAVRTIALQEAIEQVVGDLEQYDFIPLQGEQWNSAYSFPFRYMDKADLQQDVHEHGLGPVASYIQQLFIHYGDVIIPRYALRNPGLLKLMADLDFKKTEDMIKDQTVIRSFDGVGIATNFIDALQKKIPRHLLGPALERSMPVMYAIASQNQDSKGSAYVIEKTIDYELKHPEKVIALRQQLYESIKILPTELQEDVRSILLENLMYAGIYDKDPDRAEIMNALIDLETRLQGDMDLALRYAIGLAVPHDSVLPESFEESVNDRCTYFLEDFL